MLIEVLRVIYEFKEHNKSSQINALPAANRKRHEHSNLKSESEPRSRQCVTGLKRYAQIIMRLLLSCMQCQVESDKPSGELQFVEFNDSGHYTATCSAGHTTTTILQEQKFEVLFDIAAHAIIDGYYREAVSSFTSSLERFYEFCIKVICNHMGVSEEMFAKSWKSVANQSERQLGAFFFLWLTQFGEPPALLSTKEVSFRNGVIHKGKIPSRDEALKYGQRVLDTSSSQLANLRCKGLGHSIQAVVHKHVSEVRKSDESNDRVSFCSTPTIVSLTNGDPTHYHKPLEAHLSSLSERRKVGLA